MIWMTRRKVREFNSGFFRYSQRQLLVTVIRCRNVDWSRQLVITSCVDQLLCLNTGFGRFVVPILRNSFNLN